MCGGENRTRKVIKEVSSEEEEEDIITDGPSRRGRWRRRETREDVVKEGNYESFGFTHSSVYTFGVC